MHRNHVVPMIAVYQLDRFRNAKNEGAERGAPRSDTDVVEQEASQRAAFSPATPC